MFTIGTNRTPFLVEMPPEVKQIKGLGRYYSPYLVARLNENRTLHRARRPNQDEIRPKLGQVVEVGLAQRRRLR